LSFFDTAFFDAVEREKERYDGDAIELVAEANGSIVGLLDLECESDGLSARPGAGGMIGASGGGRAPGPRARARSPRSVDEG
jgi:hypothetical protein